MESSVFLCNCSTDQHFCTALFCWELFLIVESTSTLSLPCAHSEPAVTATGNLGPAFGLPSRKWAALCNTAPVSVQCQYHVILRRCSICPLSIIIVHLCQYHFMLQQYNQYLCISTPPVPAPVIQHSLIL